MSRRSFHYRICGICSVNWVLTQNNNNDLSKLIAVCDKCKDINNLSKARVENATRAITLNEHDMNMNQENATTSLDEDYHMTYNDLKLEKLPTTVQHTVSQTDEIKVIKSEPDNIVVCLEFDNDNNNADTLVTVKEEQLNRLITSDYFKIDNSKTFDPSDVSIERLQCPDRLYTQDDDSQLDDITVDDNQSLSSLQHASIDISVKYFTPDLILSRIDDMYNISKPCCHQCRVCPKICYRTSTLARHERIHNLPYARRMHDRKHAIFDNVAHDCDEMYYCCSNIVAGVQSPTTLQTVHSFRSVYDKFCKAKEDLSIKQPGDENVSLTVPGQNVVVSKTGVNNLSHNDLHNARIEDSPMCALPDVTLRRVDNYCNIRKPCCHQCRVCPKIFQRISALARHERTHTLPCTSRIRDRKPVVFAESCSDGLVSDWDDSVSNDCNIEGRVQSPTTVYTDESFQGDYCLYGNTYEDLTMRQPTVNLPETVLEQNAFVPLSLREEIVTVTHDYCDNLPEPENQHASRDLDTQQTNIIARSEQSDSIPQAVDKHFKTTAHIGLPFTCCFCSQRFTSKVEIMKHEKLHRPQPSEECGICQEIIGTELLLMKHLRSNHCQNSLFSCNSCSHQSIYVHTFISHVRLHTGKRPYVCMQCQKRFIDKVRLVLHVKSKHKIKTFNKIVSTHQTCFTSKAETYQKHACSLMPVTQLAVSVSNSLVGSQQDKLVRKQIVVTSPPVTHKSDVLSETVSKPVPKHIIILTAPQPAMPKQTVPKPIAKQIYILPKPPPPVNRMDTSQFQTVNALEPEAQQNDNAPQTVLNNIVRAPLAVTDHTVNTQQTVSQLVTQSIASAAQAVAPQVNLVPRSVVHLTSSAQTTVSQQNGSKLQSLLNETSVAPVVVAQQEIYDKCVTIAPQSALSSPAALNTVGVSQTNEINKSMLAPLMCFCFLCCEQFDDNIKMMKHLRRHRPDPSEKCSICHVTFKTELLLQQHYRCKHYDVSSHSVACKFCRLKYKSVKDFVSHVRMHTGEMPYVCTQCGQRCRDDHRLFHHVKYAHQYSTRYKCLPWSYRFKQLNALKLYRKLHRKLYVRAQCAKRCVNVPQVATSMNYVHSAVSEHVSSLRAVSQQTGFASKAVSQQTVSAPQAVSQQSASVPQAMSQQTVFAPQAVSWQTVSALQSVSQQSASVPQAVSWQNKNVIQPNIVVPETIGNQTIIRPQAVTRDNDSSFEPITEPTLSKQILKQIIILGAPQPTVHKKIPSPLQTTSQLVSSASIGVTCHAAGIHEPVASLQNVTASTIRVVPVVSTYHDLSNPLAVAHIMVNKPQTVSQHSVSSLQTVAQHIVNTSDAAARGTTGVHTTVSKQNVSGLSDTLEQTSDAGQVVSLQDTFCRTPPHQVIPSSIVPVSLDVVKHTESESHAVTPPQQISSNGPLIHSCSICRQQFAKRIEMIEHEQLHRTDPSEKCGICDVACSTEFSLEQHYLYNHRGKSILFFSCKFCPYRTVKVQSFISHIRVHTGGEPFMCTQCGIYLSDVEQLISHVKSAHQCSRDCKCTQCSNSIKPLIEQKRQAITSKLKSIAPRTTSSVVVVTEQSASVASGAVRVISQQHTFGRTMPRQVIPPPIVAVVKQTVSESHAVTPPLQLSLNSPLTHSCSICRQQFTERTEMIEHERLHGPDPSEKCGICQETCNNKLLLEQHYVCKHRDESNLLFSCNFCLYRTMKVKRFISHVRKHAGACPRDCRCLLCIKSIKQLIELALNEQTHIDKGQFLCLMCETRYSSVNSLRLHMRCIHNIYDEGNIREQPTVSQQAITSRIKPIAPHTTSSVVAEQPACVASVTVDKRFKMSAQDSLPHACPICSWQFSERKKMKKHKRFHRSNCKLKCGVCQKIIDSEVLLKDHYQSKHFDGARQLFTCTFCSYTSKYARNFISHVRWHTGEKPYVCTQCSKQFRSKRLLVIHIQSAHQTDMYNKGPCAQKTALEWQADLKKAPQSTGVIDAAVVQLTFNASESVAPHTAGIHPAVSHRIVSAPQLLSQQAASAPQAVSQLTVFAREVLSQQTVSAPQAVSEQTVSAPQAVSQQAVFAPRDIRKQTISLHTSQPIVSSTILTNAVQHSIIVKRVIPQQTIASRAHLIAMQPALKVLSTIQHGDHLYSTVAEQSFDSRPQAVALHTAQTLEESAQDTGVEVSQAAMHKTFYSQPGLMALQTTPILVITTEHTLLASCAAAPQVFLVKGSKVVELGLAPILLTTIDLPDPALLAGAPSPVNVSQVVLQEKVASGHQAVTPQTGGELVPSTPESGSVPQTVDEQCEISEYDPLYTWVPFISSISVLDEALSTFQA